MRNMRRRGWEIAEDRVTPEALVMRRRGVLASGLALSAGGGNSPGRRGRRPGVAAIAPDHWAPPDR